jgi:CheY-like chemotaxis protein
MALSLDAPKGLPPVMGDTERIRQIIGNLVDNAYNYTPSNGTIRVSIHTVNGNEVQVDVQDNGVGIAPEDQDRIFDRFYRGEHPFVLSTPGTGLGLPIVRQLVEREVPSLFPCLPINNEVCMARILIAEDEPDIRELVAFTLRFAGYEVTAASNGEEAVKMASQVIPDIILMDVRMPRMTGYDACRLMKANPELKDIPVVFLSAKGQDSEIAIGFEAGAEEYMLKPFGPDQLTERVKAILAKFGK